MCRKTKFVLLFCIFLTWTFPSLFSLYVAEALQARVSYLDRKRKFEGEELGIPSPKHVCSDQTYTLKYDFSSIPSPEDQPLYGLILKPEWTRMTESEESAKDSISSVCTDSMNTVSGIAAEYQCHSEEQHSTSSVNISKNPIYYSETTSANKLCMNDEDYLQEFESHMDFSCSKDERTSFEDCTDEEELEDILHSNGAAPNYVLSSGRWTVNQGNFYLTYKN